MKKVELHNKESYAEMREDVGMEEFTALSKRFASDDPFIDVINEAVVMLMSKIIIDGEDKTADKEVIYMNMGVMAGAKKLFRYTSDLLEGIDMMSSEEKKK